MQPFRIYGASDKPAQPIELTAGPITLLFDNGEIRYLKLGQTEILRRVYVAVRDRNWRTILPALSDLQIERRERSFEVRFHMAHNGGGLDYSWDGKITGSPAGEVRFEMRGAAGAAFLTNRTGFCVLHPSANCAGGPCTIEHADGSEEAGSFPREISPHQPFRDIRAIRHRAGKAEVRVLMEGEIFEMEDQRNWSDGSYKTYCRPLDLPRPYELNSGEKVEQTITITVSGDTSAQPPAIDHSAPIRIDLVGDSHGEWVAHVGLAVADGFDQLDEGSLGQLASMKPRHLRLDLDLGTSDWREKLLGYSTNLRRMGVPVNVALTCGNGAAGALKEFAAAWPKGLTVGNWLILSKSGVTTLAQVDAAREQLSAISPNALFGGGTSAEFVAVNRQRPPMEQLDLLIFALNPQVHAFDNLSLVENLESNVDLIESAIKLSGDRPISVSPITLKRRFNPDATGPDGLASTTTLPASVDPRQMSLFAAAWTVGSLSRLCHADFLTYFETHGWRGVLQGNRGPALPELFPAAAGDLFPVYHVLKSFLTFHPEHWSAPAVDRPLEMAAIHLLRPDRNRLLIANLEPSRPCVTTCPRYFSTRLPARTSRCESASQ